MSLPELVRRSAEKQMARFCRERSGAGPEPVRIGYKMAADGSITLFQERSAGRTCGPRVVSPVARFQFEAALNQWTLHYPGPDQRWRFYLNAGPTLHLEKLLRHLEEDPLQIFWTSD